MARCMERVALQRANGKRFVINEQVIELASVAGHTATCIEQRAEHFLHRRNLATDSYFSTELFLQVGRSRQVVCMDVGLKNPVDPCIEFVHPRNQSVGRRCGGVAGFGIVIKYAVDYSAVMGGLIQHKIADGIGSRVEESFDVKFYAHDLSP